MRIDDFVVYEDDSLIAINKPAGLLSVPDRLGKDISLKRILQEKFGSIFTIHRLDRNTSGLILFAKTDSAHRHLSMQFEARTTSKIYYGLLSGTPETDHGTINVPIAEHPVKKGTMITTNKGKEAITDYEVTEKFSRFSWTKFRIHTGRTHQVRVHAKYIGHPIACDEVYGDGKPLLLSTLKHRFKLSKDLEEERPLLNRLALHSSVLTVTDETGKEHVFEAPLPKDLRATLQQMRKIK